MTTWELFGVCVMVGTPPLLVGLVQKFGWVSMWILGGIIGALLLITVGTMIGFSIGYAIFQSKIVGWAGAISVMVCTTVGLAWVVWAFNEVEKSFAADERKRQEKMEAPL